MPSLRLENSVDSIDLGSVMETGYGVEALSGVTGLGLPPMTVQWLEGAGDGAIYRGQRVLPRDIDIPIYLRAQDRDALKALADRLSLMLVGAMTLRWVEDDGTSWTLEVHRVGGGTYVYGEDTRGGQDLQTVLTVRAGDPFWTHSVETVVSANNSGAGRGLIRGGTGNTLAYMRLASSQVAGVMTLENIGNVPSHCTWKVTGPCTEFSVTSEAGDSFSWAGTLTAGQYLLMDTKTATIVDHTGANRYAELGTAPFFWRIPPGITSATIAVDGTESETSVTVRWHPRRWLVI